MFKNQLRLVLVGASSLLGKELSEELSSSALSTAELMLVDAEAAEGQITTVGDEPSFIQRIDAATFDGADFAFFAGAREQTRTLWKSARQAGATVIDLTGALAGDADVMVWSPWLTPLSAGANGGGTQPARRPDLQTTALLSAHPVATALAVLAGRLAAKGMSPASFAATVLQPASEFGTAGLDELHQQTVSLLSFKDLPQSVFDGQAAFNVLAGFGEEAPETLSSSRGAIQQQYQALSKGVLPELSLQLFQVPVFHGYTGSIYLELATAQTIDAVKQALAGSLVQMTDEKDPPSNLSAAGNTELFLAVQAAGAAQSGTKFWLTFALDNLKAAAANAIECALAMRSLRPQGKVQ